MYGTLRERRTASWSTIILALIGSLALLIGIFVAVLSIPEVVSTGHPGSKLPMQGALYVGTNTCFTCHGDEPLDWSLLYKQTVVNPAEKPQAIASIKPGDQVQQIDAGDIVDAYTTADEVAVSDDIYHQNYIIRTEDGRLLVPQQSKTDGVSMNSAVTACDDCHTTDRMSKTEELQTIRLTRPDRVVRRPDIHL